MGTFGTDPFDNDSALDFISDIINEKAVKKLINQKDPDVNELRVATAILIHLHKLNNLWFEEATVSGMVDCLERVLEDGRWFDTWVSKKDADVVRKEIKNNLRALKKILAEDLVYW